MLEEIRPTETMDRGGDEFVQLRYVRDWPRYSVEWSLRRRSGQEGSSFPISQGRVDTTESSPDWDDLRERALTQAGAVPTTDSLDATQPIVPTEGFAGRIARLFRGQR